MTISASGIQQFVGILSRHENVRSVGKGVDPDTKVGGGRHTCQPTEKFWRDKRGATERSEPTSERGSGGPPPENFKNLHGKWCNLRYS